ncbi:MAG: deoxynucleoside kinase [Caldilineaceae bacterium]|nr:deoxynucleoside kinase [Caldilineaceae bacterium]
MTAHFIAIAGNIGVGKSTLTRLLSQELGWTPFYEAVDDNPYLPDFYADMRRWSFHSQIFFLGRRLRHHRQLVNHPTPAIQDRSVYEDAEIFARNLYTQGQMDARDYAAYRELYTAIIDFLPPPRLIVYLRASLETLTARVQRRGREYEQAIPPDYLARLNDLYEEWISAYQLSPVLVIQTDWLDVVENPEHRGLVVEVVRDALAAAGENGKIPPHHPSIP